ncbi:hypothetical protein X729_12780 [Mesorhizobium sp. L103C131B0]|nr:hypothetical protein X729_12780 [Mesorhizobium sp. L103C131B0]
MPLYHLDLAERRYGGRMVQVRGAVTGALHASPAVGDRRRPTAPMYR